MVNALFNGIMENSGSILDGVISIVGTVFKTLAGMIPRLWQLSVDGIMYLVQGITENAPTLFDTITKIALDLIAMLTAEMPKFLQSGIDMVLSLINGISQSAPLLIEPALNLIMTLINKLLESMPSIIDAGLKLISGLGVGIINAIPSIVDKLPAIIGKIIEFIIASIPQIVSAGVQLLVALVKNTPAIIFGLLKAIPTIIGALLTGLGSCVSQFWDMGVNLIKGLWEGIKSVGKWLRDKIAGFFGGVVDSIKDFFGIHSPSTLMRDDIGWFAGLGVGAGFEKSMGVVKKQMNSSLNGVIGSMQKSVAIDTSVAGTSKVVYANNIEQDTNARTSQLDLKTAVSNAFENTKVVLDKREVGRILVVKGA
jgi:phage-related protein